MAYRTLELDGKLVVVIDDRQLATALKTFDYVVRDLGPLDAEMLTALVRDLTDQALAKSAGPHQPA